uniref:Uncharacterized protein n=1 Tax=Arundo donax TaxID=35708 RepID=A0A0A9EUK5_ARUDO
MHRSMPLFRLRPSLLQWQLWLPRLPQPQDPARMTVPPAPTWLWRRQQHLWLHNVLRLQSPWALSVSIWRQLLAQP